MWNLCVEHWGCHHKKKKQKKPSYGTHHLKLICFIRAVVSLLITSCVQVATLAMKPQLKELWLCSVPVQDSRPCYSIRKIKQKEYPVISCHVWHIPHILTGWLLVMSFILRLALLHNYMTDQGIFFGINGYTLACIQVIKNHACSPIIILYMVDLLLCICSTSVELFMMCCMTSIIMNNVSSGYS